MGKIKKNDNRRSRCGRSVVDFCPWLENERDDRPGRGRTFPSTIRSPNPVPVPPCARTWQVERSTSWSRLWLVVVVDRDYGRRILVGSQIPTVYTS